MREVEGTREREGERGSSKGGGRQRRRNSEFKMEGERGDIRSLYILIPEIYILLY